MAKLNILLVEDEPDIREITAVVLGMNPVFEVAPFESGAAALDFIVSTRTRFDVALLDYRLPDMTGLDLARKLRLLPGTSETRLMLFTASLIELQGGLPPDIELVGIIPKPFDPARLSDDIVTHYQANRRVENCRLRHVMSIYHRSDCAFHEH